MAEQENHDPAEGTFLSHLVELRNRLIYAVAAVLIVFVALVYFAQEIYVIVATPLMAALPEQDSMIATEPAAPFFIPIKLTLAVAVVITIPYLLYQLWAFVAPGLYQTERKLAFPLLVSSTVLFYAGMIFAYFVVFPIAFSFFTSYAPEGVRVMTDIHAYLSFVLRMFFAFGFAFEVPIAIILLARAGIVDPDALASKRPYVVLGAFVIAMLITPPDAFSQTFLAIPMLLLFEVGIFFARRMRRPEDDTVGDADITDEEMDAEIDQFDRALAGGGKTGGNKTRGRRSK
ncbi:MAG: twin-arginine translocase subunit TatC [Acidiferrobacterales bacterium]